MTNGDWGRVALACAVLWACGDEGGRMRGQRAFDPVSGGASQGQPRDAGVDASAPTAPTPRDAAPDPDSSDDASEPPLADGADAAVSTDIDAGPGTDPVSTPVACGQSAFAAEPEGLRFLGACEGTSLSLLPAAKIGGVWYGAGRTGPCLVESAQVVCSMGALGRVGVEVVGGRLRPFWDAAVAAQLEELGLEGELTLPSATGFLSNGFQSWSQSGVLALGSAPDSAALSRALAARGEDEVYRKGSELSWWYTFVGGGTMSFSAGAVSAERMRSWTQVYREGARLRVRLMSGAGLGLAVTKGERVTGEWFQVEVGDDLEAMLRRYGEALRSRRTSRPVPTPAGWNSWYDLWDDVEARDIVAPAGERNADLAKAILGPHMPSAAEPLWIVVDDGWQKAWGDWTTNEKFPEGLEGLAKAIEARGMRTGLWFAPLLVHPRSDVARQHPDWLVRDVTYDHPAHGAMRVLDVTHPDAAAHLTGLVRGFVAAGVGLLKIDFLFAGTWEGGRYEQVTGMQAYGRALGLIRAAAGDEVQILAVGAPPVGTFEHVDVWRVGNDIAFKPLPIVNYPRPTFSFIANQARQITARFPFCLATLCDADPILLRALDREQVEAGAWVAASTGGALFLSDDLTKLPAQRRSWGLDEERVTLALSGKPATPESFFPSRLPTELVNMKDPNNLFSAEHDVPSVWRLADGTRLGFNFTGRAVTVEGTTIPARSVRKLAPAN